MQDNTRSKSRQSDFHAARSAISSHSEDRSCDGETSSRDLALQGGHSWRARNNQLSKQLRLQLNIDNAFDRDYQTAYGFKQAPRTVMLGLRYSPSF